MQVSVKVQEGLKRQMTVVVPPERIENAVDERIKELMPTVKLPGFRAGKVPKHEVIRRYGSQVRKEILGKVLQESFYDAIQQEKLQVIGVPEINPKADLAGQPLEYTASFEILPEFSLVELTGVSIASPIVTLQESDIDTAVEGLRKQHTRWVDVDRAAQEGDRVIMDYKGMMEGKEFAGGSSNNVPIVVGSRALIPGFEDGLVGLKAGDEKNLELTFPEKYDPSFAGKPVTFAVKVTKVAAPELPALDDALADKFAIKQGGLEGLRKEVKKNLQRTLDQTVKTQVRSQVIENLLKINQVDTPDTLVDNEMTHMQHQVAYQYAGGSKDVAQKLLNQIPRENFREQAQKNVKIGLIFGKVIRDRNLKADASRVKQYIETMSEAYQNPDQMVKWYYSNKQQLAEIERVVLEEQVIEILMEKATVNKQPMTYTELVSVKQ